MAVRRLAESQPASFAFTDENRAWADQQIAKYPEGRQASAVISLLWKAQEQEGWVSEPAISAIAEMLDMPKIRVLEIATFYTMFHLEPVGSTAHIQVCGTTPCWLRGSDALMDICKRRINPSQHHLSDDGSFSWEEVECLGACVNAPLVQINADTFEDLDGELFEKLLDDLAAGRDVKPGPQVDRQFSAPEGGYTSLIESPERGPMDPASFRVQTEEAAEAVAEPPPPPPPAEKKPEPVAETKAPVAKSEETAAPELPLESKPAASAPAEATDDDPARPEALDGPREGKGDDLRKISGVGPKIEGILHELGIWHFDQIAAWSPESVAWVDTRLKFKGRIDRENWIEQATILASGGETEFSSRGKKKRD